VTDYNNTLKKVSQFTQKNLHRKLPATCKKSLAVCLKNIAVYFINGVMAFKAGSNGQIYMHSRTFLSAPKGKSLA
jgi:hypothetical protein